MNKKEIQEVIDKLKEEIDLSVYNPYQRRDLVLAFIMGRLDAQRKMIEELINNKNEKK